VISSGFSYSVTSNVNYSLSIAIRYCLACVWRTPVMNPYGKNNPGIQYEFGFPFLSQFSMKATLTIKSLNHDDSGLRER
jgi:hypothetical protein